MSVKQMLPNAVERALFDITHTRRIEARAAVQLPPHTLMARAGEAVARLALALAPHAQRVWIAAGPGNNGGDGLEAAAWLRRAGKQVELSLYADLSTVPADAHHALLQAQAAGVGIHAGQVDTQVPLALGAHDIAIDGLLGIGAARPPSGLIARAVQSLNTLACPVLAIDLPSGLHADTGQALGEACVVATHTLSLLTLKPGLFTGAGRDHAGTVWFDDLGIDTAAERPEAQLSACSPIEARLQSRRHAQHKGSFGDVAVVGGTAGMTGAALLAARAAHAAGAGRVFVELLVAGGSEPALDPLRPELMFRPGWSLSGCAPNATVVCGCGGGDAVRAALPRLLSTAARLVLDADALNALSADASLITLLQARARRHAGTVLTPHPLEAARLLGCDTAQVQADRLRAAHELSERLQCVVVLKGSGSIVAAPGRTPRINPTGNATLASAGSGDVLAGWLGGLWAQSASGVAPSGPFDVAVRAVWEHGAAAHSEAHGPMRAGDLIEAMHRRLR